jgi:hypothetical protein
MHAFKYDRLLISVARRTLTQARFVEGYSRYLAAMSLQAAARRLRLQARRGEASRQKEFSQ